MRLGADEVLVPGFVDNHVHVNEPGRTEWEGFATATRAAALGGVTTILDMPLNSIPPTVDVDALRAKQEAAQGQCFVDIGFWGGAVPGHVGDLAGLHEAGVFGFTCFLIDSGVTEFPPLEPEEFAEQLAEVARLGALMIVHAEDPGDIAAAPDCHGGRYADFLASRPRHSEERAIGQLLDGVRVTGARAHLLHLADGDAVPALQEARAEGLPLTVETCPHYLTFTAEQIADGHTEFRCCPPIREADSRDALWAALADGTIDIVASDHSPSEPSLKQLETGDFGTAWGEISGLQVAVPAVWTGAAGEEDAAVATRQGEVLHPLVMQRH
ncbi:allantoinase [Serinicoccus sp. CNJ-927]|nr:allantoinase [Serinicoccus sp. CNJ-927]